MCIRDRLGSAGRPEHLRTNDEPVLLNDPVIASIAIECGATPAQVLLQWGIARGTAVIPKSVSPQRLKENLGALELKLPAQSVGQVNQLDRQRRYFDGRFWNFPEKGYTTSSLWNE
jgi:alcohol dehydrogenase (NADP+)